MSVASLKSKRRTKKNQLNQYAKRRDAVKTILKNIKNKTDDDISDINKRISSCSNNLSYGISGVGKVITVTNEINRDREPSVSGDGNLSSCSSYLSREVTRCQNKINSLDREIRELERQIKEEGGTIYFWE